MNLKLLIIKELVMDYLNELAIIIPTLEPSQSFIELLEELNEKNDYLNIIVVNDGSPSIYDSIFERAKDEYHATVLTHSVNMGKGQGIKTALNYILKYYPNLKGAITIDSDGQHTYTDMLKCAEVFYDHPYDLILGSRDFANDVPLKSKFGNVTTRNVLRILTGIDLQDTQTGLRIIPVNYFEPLLTVPGQRFEYELNMLIYTEINDINIIEVPISTIYENNNEGTHFRPVVDSVKIYSVFIKYLINNSNLLKYAFASILCWLIDITVFNFLDNQLTARAFGTIAIATIVSRVLSSITNYLLNRFFVFKESSNNSGIKYFTLVVIQLTISTVFVYIFDNIFVFIDTSILKVIVDTILFIVSYTLQKRFIFNEE